ncbi:unnamed protein product [Effrenium voratum]|nr:unnamed protein product [Effrenium voratum]
MEPQRKVAAELAAEKVAGKVAQQVAKAAQAAEQLDPEKEAKRRKRREYRERKKLKHQAGVFIRAKENPNVYVSGLLEAEHFLRLLEDPKKRAQDGHGGFRVEAKPANVEALCLKVEEFKVKVDAAEEAARAPEPQSLGALAENGQRVRRLALGPKELPTQANSLAEKGEPPGAKSKPDVWGVLTLVDSILQMPEAEIEEANSTVEEVTHAAMPHPAVAGDEFALDFPLKAKAAVGCLRSQVGQDFLIEHGAAMRVPDQPGSR